MRSFLLLLPVFAVTACQQTLEPEFKWSRFNLTPLGEHQPLTQTKPQGGSRLYRIERDSLHEIAIAQGGAMSGAFDIVRITGEGQGYVVMCASNSNQSYRADFSLSGDEMSALVAAARRDRLHRLPAMLGSDVNDGTVGFVQVATSDGSNTCWLNSHFKRVANLFEFCNKVVWPKVIKNNQLIVPATKVDGKAEYKKIYRST